MSVNIANIILILMTIIGMFTMVKIIEKNIPILLKRKRADWEAEKKEKKIKKHMRIKKILRF